jgi:hypothetical protein
MAIKNPTNLFIKFSADLKIDAGNGTVNTQPVINNSINIPFSGYSAGSIDLAPGSAEIILGTAEVAILSASAAIDVRLDGNTDTINTKLFTYNGDVTDLFVTNNTSSTITIEYVLGKEL